MTTIPVACRKCGHEADFVNVGEVQVSVEVWKAVKIVWDSETNALGVEVGRLESEVDAWDIESEFEDAKLSGYQCIYCRVTGPKLEDLVAPKYGVDKWYRVLDDQGRPHGPMQVNPDQMEMDQ